MVAGPGDAMRPRGQKGCTSGLRVNALYYIAAEVGPEQSFDPQIRPPPMSSKMSSQRYVKGNSQIDQELTNGLNSRARKRPHLQVSIVYPALGPPSSHGHPGSATQIDGSLQGPESLTERNDAHPRPRQKQTGRNRRAFLFTQNPATRQKLTGAI